MAVSHAVPDWFSTLRTVPFAIPANSWTLSSNTYTYTFNTEYVTLISKEIVTFDETLEAAAACLLIDKKSGGGGLVFSTTEQPDSTINGTIYVVDRDDGRIPVLLQNTVIPITNGGTGANSLAGAQSNLGIQNMIDTTVNSAIATAITNVKLALFPIGSIYTSTQSTDPSTFIGGTWVRIKDTFLLAAGDDYAAGDTGGEAEHTLTLEEAPAHTHTRGTMEIEGGVGPLDDMSAGWFSGAMYRGAGQSYDANSTSSGGGWRLMFQASRSWTGETSSEGGDLAHNNMPPYLVVYVWKRTA